jgi:hypothetical protein
MSKDKIAKNKKDETVTRGILETGLKKALEPYVTKKYLKKELGRAFDEQNKRNLAVFATKTELKKAFDEQNKRNLAVFATKDDLKTGLGGLEQKMNWKFDKLLTSSEKIYAKLEKKEMEQAAHDYLHKSAEDKLTDHEHRITKLEKAII